MMQEDVRIAERERAGPFVRVVLVPSETTSARIAVTRGLTPGRFVLALLDGYLRTPLFPIPAPDGSELEMLVPDVHPAAQLAPNTVINLLGPLGHGFRLAPTVQRLLLVADTTRLPLLLGLALEAVRRAISTALLLEAEDAGSVYPLQLLPAALEVRLMTRDGSAGARGTALELFPDLARWADCICLADEPARYPAYAESLREVRLGPAQTLAQALTLPPLACGVGACLGCAVLTAHGPRLSCRDGPVFNLELR